LYLKKEVETMSSGETVRDYDFLITDSNGTRKVKNGIEYPITEDDLPKKHQDSGCTECIFVGDPETILAFKVNRQLRQTVGYKPIFVGKFTMPGWVGHSGFYLFKCKECNEVCVDYPHGYTDYGLIYLVCCFCGEKLPLEVTEERSIYERERVYIPKPTREERIQDLNDTVADMENKGVRVITSFSRVGKRSKMGFFRFLRKIL